MRGIVTYLGRCVPREVLGAHGWVRFAFGAVDTHILRIFLLCLYI